MTAKARIVVFLVLFCVVALPSCAKLLGKAEIRGRVWIASPAENTSDAGASEELSRPSESVGVFVLPVEEGADGAVSWRGRDEMRSNPDARTDSVGRFCVYIDPDKPVVLLFKTPYGIDARKVHLVDPIIRRDLVIRAARRELFDIGDVVIHPARLSERWESGMRFLEKEPGYATPRVLIVHRKAP